MLRVLCLIALALVCAWCAVPSRAHAQSRSASPAVAKPAQPLLLSSSVSSCLTDDGISDDITVTQDEPFFAGLAKKATFGSFMGLYNNGPAAIDEFFFVSPVAARKAFAHAQLNTAHHEHGRVLANAVLINMGGVRISDEDFKPHGHLTHGEQKIVNRCNNPDYVPPSS